MRKILLTLVLGLCSLTLLACKNQEEETTIAREDQFVVGLECAYAPFNWTSTTKTITSVLIDGGTGYCDGYDVKIARLIALHLDKVLVVKAIDWDGLIPALNDKTIDAIIAGMSPTEERKLSIDFSEVYYRSEQVVVVKKDGEFANATSVNDFSGAKITGQANTLQVELTGQLTGAEKATPLPDYASLVTATTSDTVDGFIAELPVAMQVISTNPSLKYISFAEGSGFSVNEEDITTSIGLRKNDTVLKAQINEVLATISLEVRNEWMSVFVSQ
ncbi:MAG: ABC-type transport system, substrate-binding and permease component [Haloplasmataceae bacterium]|nr:ABC-type transport system, substrate-binding and permease component [Haloplasmataceae bacterium]